ncbi:carboxypeptidase regulatory-like domain-containing protein [Chitinophaga silvatica]|uniref:Carboxypeptidase regulatory-like domain-containing protein n=1 Tax=Chitinophaga silvatica TaxID=2282649 RepID=A0A3E1YA26_9BACT|nr:carboxypeptidase-like regulatory domain-containing protein [Chitinophaga silvatica]RFS22569.1 carboxypeptidase regulatory-like domain-containing protein [Chitinophaga silvatica]
MKTKYFFVAALILAGCSKSGDSSGAPEGENITWGQQPQLPTVSGDVTFNLSATQDQVNVMGTTNPRMPNFPSLTAKAKTLRGFVADLSGKPIKGAYIGIRATLDGGLYSGASGETNEKGYYEISLPSGAIHFYAAGYTIDYGQGRATVGLYAADGNVNGFAYQNGAVKNFVLLSYGVANPDMLSQRPKDETNYFGGSIYVSYPLHDPDDPIPTLGELPLNAEIVLTLKPDGNGLFGENKTFIINKKVGTKNFNINNIPVGKYTITAKLKDGRQLKIRGIGANSINWPNYGVLPREATGTASIFFTPLYNSTPATVLPHAGNWRNVELKLELP